MSTTQYVDVERTLNKLEEADISPVNIQTLREFVDHCAAEGISEVQQERLVYAWKTLLTKYAPDGFVMQGGTEEELKQILAGLNRSDYADSTKVKCKTAVKKFYRIENGGQQPEKTRFFTVGKEESSITREDLFTEVELKQLLRSFSNVRDRAFTLVLYESAARPGELLSRNIGDFTSNEKGDFIFIEGLKNTPDRTNQVVRAGRTLREWLLQHPLGGELGDVDDPSAPLWVKTEQQECLHCREIPQNHDVSECAYEPDFGDRLNYASYYRRFKSACEKAEIPDNKTRPYNLRHTRLTEVATFMGYEQLNKFAGWKPGSDRAKVYVHLNNDDVNRAIREEYGLDAGNEEADQVDCPFCGATNRASHSECRQCGRPLSLRQQVQQDEKLTVLERLKELDERGLLDKLEELESK